MVSLSPALPTPMLPTYALIPIWSEKFLIIFIVEPKAVVSTNELDVVFSTSETESP